MGGLTQAFATGEEPRLRFFGAHAFDLLDKISREGGGEMRTQLQVICEVLNAIALSGAPVVRIWGSLKTTGSSDEIEEAMQILSLVLFENAARERPLRFVIVLANHQRGFGQPNPNESLDGQTAPGWSARAMYTEGGWRRDGAGQLAERLQKYANNVSILASKYVLAWELVNELDTFASVAGGTWRGPEADKLATTFLIPAANLLAAKLPQPILIADLRGNIEGYAAFADKVIAGLDPSARSRLVWTSHVYMSHLGPGASRELAAEEARATRKLDVDLAIAKKHGLPFFLGEIGQHVPGGTSAYCAGGVTHDVPRLLSAVLDGSAQTSARRQIELAAFWGEGICDLRVDGLGSRLISIGAGGDTADLGPAERDGRDAVVKARAWPRFVIR